jgi:hypothetical protein
MFNAGKKSLRSFFFCEGFLVRGVRASDVHEASVAVWQFVRANRVEWCWRVVRVCVLCVFDDELLGQGNV